MSVKDEIKNILESISGIGIVYDRFVNAKTEAEVKERFVKDNIINAIIFIEIEDNYENLEGFEVKEQKQKFRFSLFFGYDFKSNSDLKVNQLKTDIITAFNTNETLNNSVSTHDNMDMTGNIFATLGNLLCHLMIFELTTYNNLELT